MISFPYISKISENFRRQTMKKNTFMKGRYGFDLLFFAITALCLLTVLLSYTVLWRIPHISIHGVLGVTCLIMIANTSRIFSKNISKRQAENIKFKLMLNKLSGKGGRINTGNKGYIPLRELKSSGTGTPRCKCEQLLEIPKEKGDQIVLCPRCGKRNLISK